MKKLLFLFIAGIAGTISVAHAQIEKGNVLVGGDLANINTSFGNNSNFQLNVDPQAAWFVADNFAIGAAVTLGFTTSHGNGNVYNYAVGPIARYYFSPADTKQVGVTNPLQHGRFFVNGGFGVGGQTGSAVGFNLHFGPGYAYFITPNVSVEGLVEYQGNFGTGVQNGLKFDLGFGVYLPSARIKKAIKDPSQL